MAARMRFFRPASLTLSPSKRSMARHWLPPSPALKSLAGSGKLAPWEKVSFTLSLSTVATARMPSRDQTGLPIHFHSSMISGSAARTLLRMLARVLPRKSVSFAISWSIRAEADSAGTDFVMAGSDLLQGLSPDTAPQATDQALLLQVIFSIQISPERKATCVRF